MRVIDGLRRTWQDEPRQKTKIIVGSNLRFYRASNGARVNDSRNRRHNKILRKTLVQRMPPKRHFRFRSAR
jgi:hypothetical protein